MKEMIMKEVTSALTELLKKQPLAQAAMIAESRRERMQDQCAIENRELKDNLSLLSWNFRYKWINGAFRWNDAPT